MSDATPRRSGTVKFYSEKGYGFIIADDSREIFMHISEWVDYDRDPQKGQRVTYVEGIKDRRPVALQVAPS
jgi:cold shock CspA family protein